MPLLDHFHPPLSDRRPWESFHTTWASALADGLNRDVLPPGYIALEQVHAGAAIEIDVSTWVDPAELPNSARGGTATATRTVWLPAAPPLVIPTDFPSTCTVEILSTDGGRTLVAAIELVSPGNKDRIEKRRLFAAKCASYLARGVGLVLVDVVTSRQANLHNEMIELLGQDNVFRMPPQSLYAVAFRPLQSSAGGRIEAWPQPLELGQPLPTLPLSLDAEFCVPLDLEASYAEACRRRRVEEALP